MNGKQTTKPCQQLQSFLMGGLGEAGRREFEEHLDACGACRSEVRSWRQVEQTMQSWSAARAVPEASPFVAKRLVQLADEGAGRVRRSRVGLPLTLAAASALAAAAAVVLVLAITGDRPDAKTAPRAPIAPRLVYTDGGEVLTQPGADDAVLSVAGEGRLLARIADDRVALGAHSSARVARATDGGLRIELVRGGIAIEAAKRTGSETLTVAARGHRVIVVGTRFSVALPPGEGLRVAVSEGAVRVVDDVGEERLVEHGQVFDVAAGAKRLSDLREEQERSMAELLTAPPDSRATDASPPAVETSIGEPVPEATADASPTGTAPSAHHPGPPDRFDHGEVRDWILAGELDRAESALETRLRKHPRDVEAWNLLANCNRKAGNFGDAVTGYRKVIEYGNAGQSNRARFQAATVLQDRLGGHNEAAALLEAYLERPTALKPLEAEAMLRLARALLRLGRQERAHATLEQIQQRFPGTNAALKARRLLDERTDG